MKNIDIGYSSLSGRVFMGKSKTVKGQEGIKQFTGDKIDITSKFLFIAEQFFKKGEMKIITGGEKESLIIHIENTKESKEKLIKYLVNELKDGKEQKD